MTTSNNEADGFSVAEKSGNNLIVGKMLKFTIDSKYKIDKADILPDNTTLVAVDVTTAWVKWQNDKPTEHRITQPGQVHPDRDDLPDQNKATWEPGLNGEPAKPWRDTRYLRLIDPRYRARLHVCHRYGRRSQSGRRTQVTDQQCSLRLSWRGAVGSTRQHHDEDVVWPKAAAGIQSCWLAQ